MTYDFKDMHGGVCMYAHVYICMHVPYNVDEVHGYVCVYDHVYFSI